MSREAHTNVPELSGFNQMRRFRLADSNSADHEEGSGRGWFRNTQVINTSCRSLLACWPLIRFISVSPGASIVFSCACREVGWDLCAPSVREPSTRWPGMLTRLRCAQGTGIGSKGSLVFRRILTITTIWGSALRSTVNLIYFNRWGSGTVLSQRPRNGTTYQTHHGIRFRHRTPRQEP